MRISINHKALCAFRKFGAVALITATIALFFTACNQTGNTGGGGKPTPTPIKYTVTLNQAEYGKVTASPAIPADGKVAKDTEIIFTATANAGYKIGKWTVVPETALQAGTGADGSPTAKVKITADASVSVSFEANSNPPNPPNVPSVEGGAVLILSPNKLTIKVRAKTADGSAITVEGCNETTLKSDMTNITELHATGTKVVLKGKITDLDVSGTYNNKQPLTAIDVSGLTHLQKLYCSYNQLAALNVQGLTALQVLGCSNNKLTALNVQGVTALKKLDCFGNQLNAKAMTKLLEALPTRTASDNAFAILYIEATGVTEGNCKDYTQPADLKKAFEDAKKRRWTLKKVDASGIWEDL